jgi:lipoic acid synthetase
MIKKPSWLKKKLPSANEFFQTENLIKENRVNTICIDAKCPNKWECFSNKTATFLILGNTCTRNCLYCSTKHGLSGDTLDNKEAEKIVETIKKLSLDYIVITSVTRDDLPDGGATHFTNVIKYIKEFNNSINVEVLTPDFNGNLESIKKIINENIAVFSINIEIVKNLYSSIRPKGNYQRVLNIINDVKKLRPNLPVKSSLLIGLGETLDDINETLLDLKKSGCDIILIGQYLRPSINQIDVSKYYTLEEFKKIREIGNSIGLLTIAGPFVRTSFKAKALYDNFKMR